MNEYYEEHGEKLLCRDCNELVYPTILKEFWGEPGHGGWVEFAECPNCGGDDFTEYHECNECFKIIPEDEQFCRGCIDKVKIEVLGVTESYPEELRDLAISEILEG